MKATLIHAHIDAHYEGETSDGIHSIGNLNIVLDTVKVGDEYFLLEYRPEPGVDNFFKYGEDGKELEQVVKTFRSLKPKVTKLVTKEIEIEL